MSITVSLPKTYTSKGNQSYDSNRFQCTRLAHWDPRAVGIFATDVPTSHGNRDYRWL